MVMMKPLEDERIILRYSDALKTSHNAIDEVKGAGMSKNEEAIGRWKAKWWSSYL